VPSAFLRAPRWSPAECTTAPVWVPPRGEVCASPRRAGSGAASRSASRSGAGEAGPAGGVLGAGGGADVDDEAGEVRHAGEALDAPSGRRPRAGSRSHPRVLRGDREPVACWWPQPCGSATVPGIRSGAGLARGRAPSRRRSRRPREPAVRPRPARARRPGARRGGSSRSFRIDLRQVVSPRVVRRDGALRDQLEPPRLAPLVVPRRSRASRAPAIEQGEGARSTLPSSVTTRAPRKLAARVIGRAAARAVRAQLAEAALTREPQEERRAAPPAGGGAVCAVACECARTRSPSSASCATDEPKSGHRPRRGTDRGRSRPRRAARHPGRDEGARGLQIGLGWRPSMSGKMNGRSARSKGEVAGNT
jgi:hypothetical protein